MRYTALIVMMMALALAGARAQSTGIRRNQQQVSRSADLVRDLTANALSDEQLSAFARRGEQKLRDFYGYQMYQSNTHYAVMNMVSDNARRSLALFRDSTVLIPPLLEDEAPLPVAEFVHRMEQGRYEQLNVQLDSLTWPYPLQPQAEGLYLGLCEYRLRVLAFQDGQVMERRHQRQQAEVWLQQVEKSFGTRGSELVWEISLGDMMWVEE